MLSLVNSLEVPMGILFVRCPNTGRDIASGVETDHASFDLTPAFTGTIRCPICKTEHRWSKVDAWISEADPLPQIQLTA
jgi:hypothetical protein